MNNYGYILTKPYIFEYVNSNIEPPQDKYIQVKYLYCSICGGDYSQFIGRRANYPISLGHEFIGKIVAVGNKVNGFKVGDYVISDFNYRCNNCFFCKNHQSHLCDKNDIQLFTNRGFFQFANIDMSYLYKIKKDKELAIYTLVEPLSCILHALEMYDLNKINSIYINGGGSIGMLFTFYLSYILNKKVYINDINTLREKNIIKNFNCATTINTYDLIIDCTNTADGLLKSLNIAKKGQNICIMSHLYGENTSFVYEISCKKELNLKFPLRNGNINNIKNAEKLINKYWEIEFNNLLSIHQFNELPYVFLNKLNFTSNKQIICISND
ncbi:MAG: alcohol dehydrogenase catalytic domain-containing protein [Massilimicrobiota sp.]|nr:alcohol dehydrogenase catalytic domain-containing protein [Massilimicrobiota sp.]